MSDWLVNVSLIRSQQTLEINPAVVNLKLVNRWPFAFAGSPVAVILVGGGTELTRTAGCPGLPPVGPRCLPAVAVSSTGLARHPEWWSAASSTAAMFSGASLPGPARRQENGIWLAITLQHSCTYTQHIQVMCVLTVGAYLCLTSLYFCSVLASLVSHASTVALLLRRAGSRSCLSAGGSVAKLVSWAEEG